MTGVDLGRVLLAVGIAFALLGLGLGVPNLAVVGGVLAVFWLASVAMDWAARRAVWRAAQTIRRRDREERVRARMATLDGDRIAAGLDALDRAREAP